MYRLTVCYSQPSDPDEFDHYYARTHAPLARQIPGLAAFTAGRCRTLDGSEPPYYLVAQLDFATEADFNHGLSSAAMKAAGADVANFATGGATMFTQQIRPLLGE